jgi:HlyD family secretion protein
VTKVSALGIEEQRVSVVLRLQGDPAQWSKLGHDFRVIARISLFKGKNLVAVPIGALFRRGADWAVFTLTEGRAALRTVEIGTRNTEHAEVTAGLAEGDIVVVHPSDRVVDGIAVRPIAEP